MSENQKTVQEYDEDLYYASIIEGLREDLYSLRIDNNYITKENERLKAEHDALKKNIEMLPYLYRQY